MDNTLDELKETVLVGLSGGVNSSIVCYLLKLQKFNLHAVTFDLGYSSLSDDFLSKTKNFCHKLNIPHQHIPVADEFTELVINRHASDVLSGLSSDIEHYEESFILTKLHELKVNLGLNKIATGHRAKILRRPDKSISFNALTQESDDRFSLAQVDVEILRDLILPLGDLAPSDIERLKDNFGVENTHSEAPCDFDLALLAAPALIKKEILYQNTDRFLLVDTHVFSTKHAFLPFAGQAIIRDNKKFDCFVTPRNQNSFLVELNEMTLLPEGEFLIIDRSSGKNLQAVCLGRVKHIKEKDLEENNTTFKF